jgi:hypothetical protein
MTWLFPLYLLGAGAVIAPILMHLRRRPPQERVEFSSLMFLEAQTPVPVRKRRLENWLLLLLRCLVLVLLALMFARPLWRAEQAAPASDQTATVVVLDRSASMRRGDLWQQARAAAEKAIARAATTDRLAMLVFDAQAQVLWSFDEDQNAAGTRGVVLPQRLAEIQPGWGGTDLGGALVEAVGLFGRAQGMAGMRRRILLISDLQEGARLEALRAQVWPETIALELHRLGAPNQDNFTLTLAASGEGSATAAPGPAALRLRLSNARESRVTEFRLDAVPPVTGHLPPGATRVLTVATAQAGAPVTLTLSGDAWDFDNRVFTAPPQPQEVRILFIGDEKTRDEAASPLFYLSRALQPTASLLPKLEVLPEGTAEIPQGTDLVVLSGAAPPAGLRTWLEAGGLAVSVITEKTTAQQLQALTGGGIWQVQADRAEEVPDHYAMLSEVRTEHPLLRPFADERLRDFTKLRFWRHRRVTPPADAALTVLARFDDDAPAMLAAQRGQGTLLLLTSGWHPADSQLALSTKFVPLLYGWLEAAGFRNEKPASWWVGDRLPTQGMVSLTLPDGQTRALGANEAVRADTPGLHTLTEASGLRTLVAVNLPPEEGRITPLDIARLRELGVRLEEAAAPGSAAAQAQDRERLALTEQEARQRAWLWLLATLLALLAAETWLAGRSRQASASSLPSPA